MERERNKKRGTSEIGPREEKSMTTPARSYVKYHPGLMSDLYHPDTMYIAWREGHNGIATFDLFARRAPFNGAFMLAAGIETALEFVREFRYGPDDLEYLARIRDYSSDFLEFLSTLRFSGDISAVREGEVVFPDEAFMRVSAPFCEAIALEAGLLQAINLATLIATKAARVVYAAQGRKVAEFALRRAQEPFVTTRSAYIGGCHSTSFLAAAYKFSLFATGSIPHALVQLFEEEERAFIAVAEAYSRYTLLLDTYDIKAATLSAIKVAREYEASLGHTLVAVRLDSGDLVESTKYVRQALDDAGLTEVRILLSNELDEWAIADLLEQGAIFDSVGVGTRLGVGSGSAKHQVEGGALGGVYKFSHYVGQDGVKLPKLKVAGEKTTWPGVKEVYRIGNFERDVIALESEPAPQRGRRLLRPVVRDGQILPGSMPPLGEIWEYAQRNLRSLPDKWRQLQVTEDYLVDTSEELEKMRHNTISSIAAERQTPPNLIPNVGSDGKKVEASAVAGPKLAKSPQPPAASGSQADR